MNQFDAQAIFVVAFALFHAWKAFLNHRLGEKV